MARPRRARSEATEVVVKRGVLNETRWAQILQAAAEEFEKKGYKAARLQDIAARVGLLTGSLYYYIESKEGLLFALVEAAHRRRLEASVEDSATSAASAPERLRIFIQRQVEALRDVQSEAAMIVERDRKYLSAEHRAQVDEMRHELRSFAQRILDDGVARGEFDPMIDIDLTTTTLFELLNSTTQWAAKDSTPSYAVIGEWYARLFLSGLAPRTTGLPLPTVALPGPPDRPPGRVSVREAPLPTPS